LFFNQEAEKPGFLNRYADPGKKTGFIIITPALKRVAKEKYFAYHIRLTHLMSYSIVN